LPLRPASQKSSDSVAFTCIPLEFSSMTPRSFRWPSLRCQSVNESFAEVTRTGEDLLGYCESAELSPSTGSRRQGWKIMTYVIGSRSMWRGISSIRKYLHLKFLDSTLRKRFCRLIMPSTRLLSRSILRVPLACYGPLSPLAYYAAIERPGKDAGMPWSCEV
jgi:hypothetical protein